MALFQQEVSLSRFLIFKAGGINIQGNGTTNSTPAATAITLGSGTNASGGNSVSLGNGTVASGNSCISIGNNSSNTGTQGIGLGISTSTAGDNDFAACSNSQCVGTGGSGSRIGIGVNVVCGAASQSFCISIGAGSTATVTGAMALGRLASATHSNATAIGINATTVSSSQIMLGGTGNQHVYSTVGNSGLMESSGYVVGNNQVRASIQPSGVQGIPSGSGMTTISFGSVAYASDYGSPLITSTPNQLQTRLNRNMDGYLSLHFIFSGGNPLANGVVTIRIRKSQNGSLSTITQQSVVILSTVAEYIVSVPFQDFNGASVISNIFYFAECDNNAIFGRLYNIQTASHFTASFIN